ncbi:recombinase family protein [Providencia alcalifaciens]
MVRELYKRDILFKSPTDAIYTGTPAGRFFFHVMVSLAVMERKLIIECIRAGLDAAKQLGRKGERKPKMTSSKIKSAKNY